MKIYQGQSVGNQHVEQQNMQQATVKNGKINGTSLNKGSLIESRGAFGEKKAGKVIQDVFKNDVKMDEALTELRSEIKELQHKAVEHANTLKDIDGLQEKINEEYKVAKDSEEYKDLLLLNKQEVYKKFKIKGNFTEAEKEKLAHYAEHGMTDYQKATIANQSARIEYKVEHQKANQEIQGKMQTITGIKLSRLKTNPMEKATEMADKIIEEIEKSIKGMIIQDSVQKIEEDDKERKEYVKNAKEEKQEQEAIEEASKKTTVGKPKSAELGKDQSMAELGEDLREFDKEVEIIMEYLKGIEIDESI